MAEYRDISPKWMPSLHDESPLLSADEWNFLAKVRSVVQNQMKLKGSTLLVDSRRKSEELFDLKNKVQRIFCQLSTCSSSVEYFQEHYPRWRSIREKNIETLRKTADEIERDRENCNVTKMVGGVTSMVGGGITLASKDRSPAAAFGDFITQLGSLAAAGASAVEMILLQADIEKAKAIVDKDRQYFDRIWAWLMDSSKLTEDLTEILDIDIWRNTKEAITEFLSITDGKTNDTDLEVAVKEFILPALKYIPCHIIKESAEVVETIMSVLMLRKHHPYLFELISHAKKIIPRLLNLTKNLLVIFASCSKIKIRENLETTSNSAVMVGMFLDAIIIADAASNIQNRSQSNESKVIRQAAEILEEEADTLREFYSRAVRGGFSRYKDSYYAF